MVLEPITLEPKSIIPPSHILLLDIVIDHNDSVIFFKTGHIKGISFMIESFMILFILGIIIMYIEKRSIKVGSVDHHIILIG